MKILSKAIIILYLLYNIISCERFYVGNVRIVASNFPQQDGKFSYTTSNNRILLQGKINNEFFTGDIYSQKTVQKVEMHRYPGVDKKTIKAHNVFAFSRLTGNRGSTIECFIRQNTKHNFKIGGIGRCYIQNGRAFDILLEPI